MAINENKTTDTKPIILSDLIIYEDADLLVINKPAGLIINQAETHQQVSLQDLVAAYLHFDQLKFDPVAQNLLPADFAPQYGTPLDIWQDRRCMVHRLDKDTSGLTVWAKNPPALINLLSQFRQRQINKTYLCLVHGLFSPDQQSGRINLPLGRKLTNRQLMAVTPTGRAAITLYQVKQTFRQFNFAKLNQLVNQLSADQFQLKKRDLEKLYQGFSLVEATLKTGRTHQIRAHFTHLKHPLVGDTSYLSAKKMKIDQLWCPRQFLHATSLEFTHPITQQKLSFTSPLPTDLEQVLTFLD